MSRHQKCNYLGSWNEPGMTSHSSRHWSVGKERWTCLLLSLALLAHIYIYKSTQHYSLHVKAQHMYRWMLHNTVGTTLYQHKKQTNWLINGVIHRFHPVLPYWIQNSALTFPLKSLTQGHVSDNVEGQELGKFDFQGLMERTITNVIRGLFVGHFVEFVEYRHQADQGQTEPRNSEICTFVWFWHLFPENFADHW